MQLRLLTPNIDGGDRTPTPSHSIIWLAVNFFGLRRCPNPFPHAKPPSPSAAFREFLYLSESDFYSTTK
ncbi:hypothetical protein [Chroococcidiopsis cubana]|uniref:hypothetical protein n=1 Tax=Chroococcidiopsis cubana TaxID=171392 RepID=UPI000F8D6D40|nr:hypothetical protein [Chroococcidiopsis cubana]